MKTKSFLILSSFLLFFGFGILAQEVELPNPGLTPDSPFYFLETITEDIRTFFTFGDLTLQGSINTVCTEDSC